MRFDRSRDPSRENIGTAHLAPMAQFSFIPSAEVSDLAEDIREIFEELAATLNTTSGRTLANVIRRSTSSKPTMRWKW